MSISKSRFLALLFALFAGVAASHAQDNARVTARMDARQITVGDQARVFLEVHNNPATADVKWPAFTDTFNSLEITEKGKIDTLQEGGNVIYRQRLLITGFDSGLFKIPAFQFAVVPKSGNPYVLQTDSFELLVQTVAVDTTKEFKPIKNIILVQSSWLDYIWYIAGGVALLLIVIGITLFFALRKKPAKPQPKAPAIPLQDRVMKQLAELEGQQLWQKGQVKEYYVQLTDIVRNYIEERFATPALELTTDEMLYKVQHHKELQPYHALLQNILHTADLAKFAKWQPLPQEHFDAMDNARKFVENSRPKPVLTETQTDKK